MVEPRGKQAAAAYQRHRDHVLSEKLRSDKTKCPYCNREMFFHTVEPWVFFSDRHAEEHGSRPSGWPNKIQQRKATMDHLLPRSRGGTDHPRNLTIMCGGCNQDKDSMTPPEWIAKRELMGRPLCETATARLLKRWRKSQPRRKREPMNTETTPRKIAEKVQPFDMTKPHFVTVRQTETRNIQEVIQGDPTAPDLGLSKIVDHATAEAERLKTNIMVFGPQVGRIEPPRPAPPTFVGMDFGNEPE